MQYIKCIVSRPGLFNNITFEFSDKINIISGKNGAGKSILANGLVDSIWFRFSDTHLLPREFWSSLYIDVHFNIGKDRPYHFINNCLRDFTIFSGSSREHIIYQNEITPGIMPISIDMIKEDPCLSAFMHHVDFSQFISASFISSQSDFDKTRHIDYQGFQKIILRDESNFFDRHISLRNFFEKGNRSDNRILSEILKYENLTKSLDRKIQLIDIQNARQGKLKKERASVWREIENFKIKTTLLNNRIEILYKIFDSLDIIDDYQKNYIRITEEVEIEKKKINSISELKNEVETYFPQFKDFKNINNDYLSHLQRIYNEIRSLNEKIDNFNSKLERRKDLIKKAGLSVNVSAFAIILSIFYKNNFSISENITIVTGIFGFSLIFSLLTALYSMTTSGTKKFSLLNEEKQELEEKLKKILEESNLHLEGYKLSELYEFLLQYFEDYIQYSERIEDIRSIRESLKNQKDLGIIKKELSVIKKLDFEIKARIDAYIHSLDIGNEIGLDKSNMKELIAKSESEIRVIEKQLEIKISILDQIDVELNRNIDVNEERDGLITEKSNFDRILSSLNKTGRSVDFIREVMDEAVKKAEEKQLSRLIDSAYDKLNFLTDKQYVSIADREMVRNIITGKNDGKGLSPVVLQALLISIKIALTEFFSDYEKCLPLIIDDPFHSMDDDRIKRFRELISDVSHKRQVILFTHHRDIKEWGNYIEL